MIQQQQQKNKSKELEERGLGMATQILSKRKSGEEELEELENNYKLKKIIKQQCSSSMIQQQHHSSLSSWSDLDSDILREINKKLCKYEDHIGFRGVCKSWRAAGRVERAGDVLPWLITLHVDSFENKLRYKLYEPEFLPENKLVVQGLLPFLTHQEEEEELENNYKIKKKIKQQYCSSSSILIQQQQHHQNKSSPFKSEDKSRESCTIRKLSAAGTIKLKDYFNASVTQPPTIFRYVDGWLHISVFNYNSKVSYFLFFSVATKASFTLPQLNDSTVSLFLALSTTTADSPDCVFLTLWLTNDYTIRVGIFRHGDTHWTITESVRGDWFGRSRVRNAVLVGGVFYFLTTTAGIGSYDLATGALRVDHFSTGKLEFIGIISFFGLDGDLMLVYQKKQTPKDYFHDCRKNKANWVPQQTQKLCISKYDWMNKVWAPLQTLGGRSLYLNYDNCVYVDYINYYRGVSSSGNKIYIRRVGQISYVDEYTLEEEADGQLSQCPSPSLVRWAGPHCIESAMWVRPPPILMSF